MPEIAIRTQGRTRRFGNLTAVDAIDLQVTVGQFFLVPTPQLRGNAGMILPMSPGDTKDMPGSAPPFHGFSLC